jgi:hypothetical protein
MKVAKLMLTATPSYVIAHALDVPAQTIHKDMKWVSEWWFQADTREITRLKDRRVKQIEFVMSQAGQAYEISKREMLPCKPCGMKGYVPGKGVCHICEGEGVVEIPTSGDPVWLRVILDSVMGIAKIEGIMGDKKRDGGVMREETQRTEETRISRMSDDEIIAVKVSTERQLRETKIEGNGNGEALRLGVEEKGDE